VRGGALAREERREGGTGGRRGATEGREGAPPIFSKGGEVASGSGRVREGVSGRWTEGGMHE